MLYDRLKNIDLLLASASPRRHELLKAMDLDFSIIAHEAEESYPPELKAADIVLHISEKKAESIKHKVNDRQLLVCSDTIVWFENEALEKPKNTQEAVMMLQRLSGEWHTVYSGVCLYFRGQKRVFYSETAVRFANLSPAEIVYYVEKHKPFDKAGSYGMQDWLGVVRVAEIKGSYTNVVGLPTAALYDELQRFIAEFS